MQYRLAIEQDLDVLAEWNHQLIRDEGHRNSMSVPQLRERMEKWLRAEYKEMIFSEKSELLGYGLFRETADEIYLRQFFIRNDRRRK